jgi:hypothetical protein
MTRTAHEDRVDAIHYSEGLPRGRRQITFLLWRVGDRNQRPSAVSISVPVGIPEDLLAAAFPSFFHSLSTTKI